jgi:hypothetical protein
MMVMISGILKGLSPHIKIKVIHFPFLWRSKGESPMRIFSNQRFEDQLGASVLAVVLGLFLTCGAAKALAGEDLREWSDTTGRHKLTARLQAFSKDAVTLEMADGKLMEIEIAKLGTKDRQYALAHRANLKKADDNPFKEKNAASLEKLAVKLEAIQGQVEGNARDARENAGNLKDLKSKLESSQNQVDAQLVLVKLRAAAARVDALLLDQQFSKVETSCLEGQVRGAEENLKIQDARYEAGTVTQADPLAAKAVLCMFKGCLAWVKGDLPQCQKEYDDAAVACKKCAEISKSQFQVGTIDYTSLFATEAAAKEAELFASRVKEKIAARESRRAK